MSPSSVRSQLLRMSEAHHRSRYGMSRRASCVAFAIAGGLALAACGSSGPSASPGTSGQATSAAASGTLPAATATTLQSLLPPDVVQKHTLSVASEIDFPPFEFYEADGKTIDGVDRALADELEKLLDIKLNFVNTSFDTIIPGLIANRFDLSISGFTDTKAREAQVTFLDYIKSGRSIMVPAGNPKNIKTLDDLCGMNVVTQKGGGENTDADAQSKTCTADGKKALNVTIYPNTNQMILALQTGRADAALIESPVGSYLVSQQQGKFAILPPYTSVVVGIVFPKSSTQLANAFKAAFEQMAASGAYAAVLDKYGMSQLGVDAFTLNGGVS